MSQIQLTSLYNKIKRRNRMSVPTVATKGEILDSIKKQVTENPIMLYMKGTKEMPMCGFSSTVVNILNTHNVEYKTRGTPTIDFSPAS